MKGQRPHATTIQFCFLHFSEEVFLAELLLEVFLIYYAAKSLLPL